MAEPNLKYAPDLIKAVERKNTLFTLAMCLWSATKTFKEVTGFEFKDTVFSYKQGVAKFCNSQSEYDKASKHFLSLAQKHDPVLKIWYDKACSLNQETNTILNSNFEDLHFSYDEFLKKYTEIFTYGTYIVYWVLAGINSALEAGTPREVFVKELLMFEKLRAETQYPKLEGKVFSVYFAKAAAILGIDKNLAGYLGPDELGDVLAGKRKVPAIELERRMAGCIVSRGRKEFEVIFDFETILNVDKVPIESIKEFKGNIAYKGKVSGIVKIVNLIKDMEGFKDGNILVSINTSPALMPAIRACAAIVTDEGGIMCHASIVSREFRKPCIIGTKIATQVLKDGDIVEVDAHMGIVKILADKK